MSKPSRKRFQEALKALKQACKNERLPFTLRIRAAELICSIYGVPIPSTSYGVKRATKELIQEGRFDAAVRDQVRADVSDSPVPEPSADERVKSILAGMLEDGASVSVPMATPVPDPEPEPAPRILTAEERKQLQARMWERRTQSEQEKVEARWEERKAERLEQKRSAQERMAE